MSTSSFSQPSQCEHCILKLLHSHFTDEQNGLKSSQINQLLTLFRGVLNSRGLIILSKDGNVEFITQQAEQLLVSFFPTTISQANLLPHHLTKWFQFQISQPLESDDSCIYQTLEIEQGKQVLKIHLIPIRKSMGDNYYLLLEKKEKTMFSVPDLELLGLTHCEAEILFWVSRDKTNIEITKLAGISEGTVRKHLEHIYKKLGVRSRVGAVIIALEKWFFRTYTVEKSPSSLSVQQCSKVDKYQSNKNSKPYCTSFTSISC